MGFSGCIHELRSEADVPQERFFSQRLGRSRKVSSLDDFQYRVWTLREVFCDDYGVSPYSATWLQGNATALELRSREEITAALGQAVNVGLLIAFEDQDQLWLCSPRWQEFQRVRWPRSTLYPAPPPEILAQCGASTRELFAQRSPRGPVLDGFPTRYSASPVDRSAKEATLRAALAKALPGILPGVMSVAQAVRIGNSYLDILVELDGGRILVIETKRHAISHAAVSQVMNYRRLLSEQNPDKRVVGAVVGTRLAENVAPGLVQEHGLIAILVGAGRTCSVVVPSTDCEFPVTFTLQKPARAGGREEANANGKQLTANSSGVEDGGRGHPIRAFLDRYVDLFTARFRDKPNIEGGKDAALVKKLLAKYGQEKLLALLGRFFDSDDPWIAKSGHSLGVFHSQINKLIAEAAGGPRLTPKTQGNVEALRRFAGKEPR